tara:strand:- start:296 stop:517 length:222 start_codon:yes stop_codon:yes gene_type:complete
MTLQKSTHKTRLLEWFKTHNSITSLEAFKELGNTRLAATIFTLIEDGKTINKETIAAPTRWNTDAHVTKYTLL